MSTYMQMDLYCPKCKVTERVSVLVSTNSWMIQADPELRKKAEDGTLFKNFCSSCGTELVHENED